MLALSVLLAIFPLLLHAQVEVIEEVEPNNSFDEAQLLEEEVYVVGGVTGVDAEGACSRPSDPDDTYRIPFHRKGSLEITLDQLTFGPSLDVEVYSEDRESTAPVRFRFVDTTVFLHCVDADTLYLRVHNVYATQCGDYSLVWRGVAAPEVEDFEPDNAVPDAQRIPFGEVLKGSVGYGRQVGRADLIDYYLVSDVPAGDITIRVESEGPVGTQLDLFGPFPRLILGGPSDSIRLECVGEIDSLLIGVSTRSRCMNYEIRLSHSGPRTSSIAPDPEPNSTVGQALQRSVPFEIEGKIGEIRFDIATRRDSVDMYSLQTHAGDTLVGYIRFEQLTTGRLVLRRENGEQLLSWSQQGEVDPFDSIPIEVFPLENERLFLAVESGEDACGFYEGSFSIRGISSVMTIEERDNPSVGLQHGELILVNVSDPSAAVIELHDAVGKKVAEYRGGESYRVDLPPGIYFYRLLLRDGSSVEGKIGVGLP